MVSYKAGFTEEVQNFIRTHFIVSRSNKLPDGKKIKEHKKYHQRESLKVSPDTLVKKQEEKKRRSHFSGPHDVDVAVGSVAAVHVFPDDEETQRFVSGASGRHPAGHGQRHGFDHAHGFPLGEGSVTALLRHVDVVAVHGGGVRVLLLHVPQQSDSSRVFDGRHFHHGLLRHGLAGGGGGKLVRERSVRERRKSGQQGRLGNYAALETFRVYEDLKIKISPDIIIYKIYKKLKKKKEPTSTTQCV